MPNAQYTDSAGTVLLTEIFPLLNEVRRVLHLKHLSHSTEASYLRYILGFIRFHGKRHPKEIGTEEIRGVQSGEIASGTTVAGDGCHFYNPLQTAARVARNSGHARFGI